MILVGGQCHQAYYRTSSSIGNLCVIGMDGFAGMSTVFTNENGKYSLKVRPVLSLKSCVKYSNGDGTPTNPYTVTIDDDCASKEN